MSKLVLILARIPATRSRSDDPAVWNMLPNLVRKQEVPNPERPLAQYLRDQVQHGEF